MQHVLPLCRHVAHQAGGVERAVEGTKHRKAVRGELDVCSVAEEDQRVVDRPRASTQNDTEPQSLEALQGSLQARNDHDGVVKSRGHLFWTSATGPPVLRGMGCKQPK